MKHTRRELVVTAAAAIAAGISATSSEASSVGYGGWWGDREGFFVSAKPGAVVARYIHEWGSQGTSYCDFEMPPNLARAIARHLERLANEAEARG